MTIKQLCESTLTKDTDKPPAKTEQSRMGEERGGGGGDYSELSGNSREKQERELHQGKRGLAISQYLVPIKHLDSISPHLPLLCEMHSHILNHLELQSQT